MGRTPETGLPLAEWCEFPRYALARILMHAVKNRDCAFLAGFRVVCCLFYRFPVRNALRASQAVHATDVMVNPADWQVQKKPGRAFLYLIDLHTLQPSGLPADLAG